MRIQDVATIAVALSLATDLTAQASWTQMSTTGPAARRIHAMAYDSQRGRTVLFGGDVFIGLGSQSVRDTWEWNGNAWTQVASTGPAARHGHAMAYDSVRGKTVLLGGYEYSGGFGTYFGDTWEWDGSAWTQVASTGPSGRLNHAMAYDSQRGRTVLFGGYDGVTLGDTWEWDGNTWTQRVTTGPSAREGQSMAHDSQRGRTVLFGGLDGAFWLGDTWEWDGSVWTQVAAAGPTTRSYHAMAFDSRRGRSVLFGGRSSGGYLGDTWEWDGSAWTQVASAGPTARAEHRMAYDSQRRCTVLFGGFNGTGGYSWLGDTWEWSGPLPSSATTFGSGCGSPALGLSSIAMAPPTINTTAQASLANIPSSLAFVALGWSRTMAGPFALPVPLGGYGMPGCYMLQSAEAAAQPVTSTGIGTATYSLPLPNWSGLIGLHVYLQGWASAPGANAGNMIVSNGVEWTIGNS